MPSTFSQNLRIELIASGSQTGVWGNTTNNNLGDLVEQAITGATEINVTGAGVTLTALNGVTDQARSAVLIVTGTPGVTRVITIPNANKSYTVKNRSNATVNIKTSSGSPFAVPTLSESYLYCDGANVISGRVITDGADAITSLPNPFNNAALTGVPTAPTASFGTNTTQIASTAFVQASLPAGVIVMWSGSIASIPAGFLLCNGASGTPDLRDRFVVGAGSTYSPGNTGGADTVTLTTAQLPSHTHSISGSGTTATVNISHSHTFSVDSGINSVGHNHTGVTDQHTGHQHNYLIGGSLAAFDGGARAATNSSLQGLTAMAGAHNHNYTTANNSVNHVHNVSGTTANTNPAHDHPFSFSGTSGATGSDAAHENRPPFFALAYIMKT